MRSCFEAGPLALTQACSLFMRRIQLLPGEKSVGPSATERTNSREDFTNCMSHFPIGLLEGPCEDPFIHATCSGCTSLDSIPRSVAELRGRLTCNGVFVPDGSSEGGGGEILLEVRTGTSAKHSCIFASA